MTEDAKARKDDEALDALFDAARQTAPKPDAAFLARLEADALAAMPTPAAVVPTVRAARKRRGILHDLGAWAAAAGLTGATALGVWIGVSLPATISVWPTTATAAATSDDTGLDISEFLPGADLSALQTAGPNG